MLKLTVKRIGILLSAENYPEITTQNAIDVKQKDTGNVTAIQVERIHSSVIPVTVRPTIMDIKVSKSPLR